MVNSLDLSKAHTKFLPMTRKLGLGKCRYTVFSFRPMAQTVCAATHSLLAHSLQDIGRLHFTTVLVAVTRIVSALNMAKYFEYTIR